MNSKLQTPQIDKLFDAILTLENREECYKFFSDVCTIKELLAISQRLEVAELLLDHTTYQNIVAETGASTATISRVNRSLSFGEDGYSLVFGRLENNSNQA